MGKEIYKSNIKIIPTGFKVNDGNRHARRAEQVRAKRLSDEGVTMNEDGTVSVHIPKSLDHLSDEEANAWVMAKMERLGVPASEITDLGFVQPRETISLTDKGRSVAEQIIADQAAGGGKKGGAAR